MCVPNASTCVLIGILALIEGFGWSDNELFEQCRFNLLVSSALGLFNINDSLPAESESSKMVFRVSRDEVKKRL